MGKLTMSMAMVQSYSSLIGTVAAEEMSRVLGPKGQLASGRDVQSNYATPVEVDIL